MELESGRVMSYEAWICQVKKESETLKLTNYLSQPFNSHTNRNVKKTVRGSRWSYSMCCNTSVCKIACNIVMFALKHD